MRSDSSDLAAAWLDALFRGAPLLGGQSGDSFGQIARAVHNVLRVYSIGFLVLGGFLLLYYALMFVAQSAHSGQIAWNKTSKMWAPLRFALVLGLLVPVGSGLNVGQTLIVKFAEQGSALASNAWQSAAGAMKGSFAGLVSPRPPDLRHVTLRAVEMSLCRAIYNHHYMGYRIDEAVRYVGEVQDIEKTPATQMAGESWRYANDLHVVPPLCGAYRFTSPSAAMVASAASLNGASLETDPAWPALGDAARAAADRLSLQADSIASRLADVFTQKAAPRASSQELEPSLSAFFKEQQDLLDARLVALGKERGRFEGSMLKDAETNGWVAASSVLFELMTRQLFLGALAERSVPAIDPPILGRRNLNLAQVREDIQEKAGLRSFEASNLGKLVSLYEDAGLSMQKARAWLYGGQMKEAELILPSSLDIDDFLAPGSDSESGFALFRRALDAGFATFGVWGRAFYDLPRASTTALTQEMKEKPIAALVEMGRRYNELGSWLMGVAGRGLSQPSVMLPAAIYVVIGGLFALAGLGLLFLVPLIPLFRFVAGILTWILLVFEAVVSVPLVALVHMSPKGDGLFSDMAKKAYGLWLSVFIRPFLMVFGFLVGWAAFFLGLLFVHALFDSLTVRLMEVQSDTLTGIRVFFALLYAGLALVITNVSFKGISFFPQRAIEWLGGLIEASGASEPVGIQLPASGEPTRSGISGEATSFFNAPLPGGGGREGSSGASGRSARRERETQSGGARSNISRDSQLIPQYREKDVSSSVSVSQDGGAKAGAVSGPGGSGAVAGTRTGGKEGAVAVAVAKASVIVKSGKDEERPSELLQEAAEEARKIKEALAGRLAEAPKPGAKPKPKEEQNPKEEPSSHADISVEETKKDG